MLLSWLIMAVAFWSTAKLLPGFSIKGFGGALWVAAIFGVINWLIGWLLFGVIGVASLGIGFVLAFLTRWLVNAILLTITDKVSSSLHIRGFSTALIGAALFSLVTTVIQGVLRIVS